MARQGKKSACRRQGHWALLAALGWSVAEAQIQNPNPERIHEYVEAGRVNAPGLQVARLENQLQAKGGFAAFVTAESLYVQELEEIFLVGICGGASFARPRTTLAVPLPPGGNGKVPVLGLLRVEREGAAVFPANVHVALAMADGKLRRENFHRTAAGRLLRTAGLPALTLKTPEAWVRAYADLREAYPGAAKQGFLILGKSGRMSLVDENAGRLAGMTETVLEPAGPADLTAQGEGWVGTAAGAAWRLAGTAELPRLEARGTPAPGRAILRIGSRSALVEGGFLLFRNGAWSSVRPGPAGLVGVLAEATFSGTRVQRFTDSGVVSVDTWDAPTTLEYRSGGGPWLPPGDQPVRLDSNWPRTYQVAIRDADRNATPPSLVLFRGDAGLPLFPRGIQADPTGGCVWSGRCLAGAESILTVEMTGDSVRLSMDVLDVEMGPVYPPCMLKSFKGGPARFTASERWGSGSELQVRVGGESLRFQYGEPASLAGSRGLRGGLSAPAGFRGGYRFLAIGAEGSRFGLDGRRVVSD